MKSLWITLLGMGIALTQGMSASQAGNRPASWMARTGSRRLPLLGWSRKYPA